MKVIVPAAGLGSRFLPVTRAIPKEMLPLGSKPLIHHALDEAEAAGFDHAVIVLAPGKSAIRRYFEDDPRLERFLRSHGQEDAAELQREAAALARRMHLEFFLQRRPAGLGDAVLRASNAFGRSGPIAVLLPDDVVTTAEHWVRLRALHETTSAACLCVREVDPGEAHRFGMAACSERDGFLHVDSLVEKPKGRAPSNLSVFGRYIVTEPVLSALEGFARRAVEIQLTDGFAAVLGEPPGVGAVAFSGEIYDAGTPGEYALANARYTAARGLR